MDDITFYIIAGLCIFVAGVVWILLLRDNAKQEKLIAKHTREIAGIKNHRRSKETLD